MTDIICRMDTNLNEKLWTSTDLMKFLGCGKTSFFEAKKIGKLPPAIIIGKGIWRWSPETVYAWVLKNESEIESCHNDDSQAYNARRKGRPTKEQQIKNRRDFK